jgi:hypothetical protein
MKYRNQETVPCSMGHADSYPCFIRVSSVASTSKDHALELYFCSAEVDEQPNLDARGLQLTPSLRAVHLKGGADNLFRDLVM